METGVCNYVITIHIGNTGNIYNIVLLELTFQLIIWVVLLSDETIYSREDQKFVHCEEKSALKKSTTINRTSFNII